VTEIKRSALLPYPARFMYDIVNEVESYPDFLPWCGGAEIHQVDNTSMQASVLIQAAGFNHWFRTRNVLVPGESIELKLVDGPFRELEGHWRFTSIDSEGSKIELALEFEFKRGLAGAIIAPVFTRIANTLVDSFCDRARELHER